MLSFVMGLPGGFAESCEIATMWLVRHAFGSAERISANTLEEITESLLCSGAAHGVMASAHPGGRVKRALVEARRPFIIARDDPYTSLKYLVSRRGLALTTATQRVASSCASVVSFSETPGALVLRADRDSGDRLSTAAAIARHLGLDIDNDEIAEIVGGLDGGDDLLDPSEVVAWWEGLDPAEQAIASGALGPYLDHFANPGPGPITWAPELFFVGDRPDEQATNGVDITGRARCLLHGPHIMLPPANWSLDVTLDMSPETTEHSFLIEATAGTVVSQIVIRPAVAGVVKAALTLALEDLADRPVDLFLSNERPAFGGHVTLLGVTLTPNPPVDAPAETEG